MIIDIKAMRNEINKALKSNSNERMQQVNRILDKNFGKLDVIVAKPGSEGNKI